jgi:hypothetical protein
MTEENISSIFNVRSKVLDVNNNRIAVPMGVA